MHDYTNNQERFAHIADWFEQLTPETLAEIDSVYAADAKFIDPFNELAGLANVKRVYQHMFDSLKSPRFIVTRTVSQGLQAFMLWDFTFLWRDQTQKLSGCTHFELNQQGLISLHRDYWDASREIYEKLPLLGLLLRYLRRGLATKLD
jgi:hypothetical protein